MQRKFFSAEVVQDKSLNDRQIRIVVSDPSVDRGGDVMEPAGCVLDNYKRNPIVLADHDPTKPIGTAATEITNGRIEQVWTFADKGISAKADEYCALYKTGVLRAASVGYDPLDEEPIKSGGTRCTKWELLETSAVAVPMQAQALIVARSAHAHKAEAAKWKCGTSRNLPTSDDDGWDGDAAKGRIFEKAGFDGDKPDTGFAAKAFLAHDSANAALKGSYKLPIADVVDGRLTVTEGAVKAAASRLSNTDIPDDVKKKAGAVLDHYKGKLGIGDGKGIGAPRTKQAKPKIKGLYDVGALAYLLMQLGWLQENAEYEAAIEEDGSKMPAMLAQIMRDLATALEAMTTEEIAEFLARLDEHAIDDLDDDELYVVAGAPGPITRAMRIGKVKAIKAVLATKAGKVLSAANEQKLRDCLDHMDAAYDHVNDVLGSAEPGNDEPDADAKAATAQRRRLAEIAARI